MRSFGSMPTSFWSRPLSSTLEDLAEGMPVLDQWFPAGHDAVGVVRSASFPDGSVEFGPLLGLVLGLEEMANGAEAAGTGNLF